MLVQEKYYTHGQFNQQSATMQPTNQPTSQQRNNIQATPSPSMLGSHHHHEHIQPSPAQLQKNHLLQTWHNNTHETTLLLLPNQKRTTYALPLKRNKRTRHEALGTQGTQGTHDRERPLSTDEHNYNPSHPHVLACIYNLTSRWVRRAEVGNLSQEHPVKQTPYDFS